MNIFSEVDVSQIDGYVKYLSDNKVDGAYIMGTTGEGYNLTNEERMSMARAWRQAVDRQKVNLFTIINVTSNCMKEALRFAKEADTLGFDGIAVLPPNYYRPNTINDWVNYLKSFASVAPNTPLVYYHIPYMSGDMNCKSNNGYFLQFLSIVSNYSRYNRSDWRRTQTNTTIDCNESNFDFHLIKSIIKT